jgi:hypothetical protein
VLAEVGDHHAFHHVAITAKNPERSLKAARQRWLDHGYHVSEVKQEFIHSVHTRDPHGTRMEFT